LAWFFNLLKRGQKICVNQNGPTTVLLGGEKKPQKGCETKPTKKMEKLQNGRNTQTTPVINVCGRKKREDVEKKKSKF